MKGMSNENVLELYKKERLGEVFHNKHGTLMKIIKYNNANDIWVEFQDEYKIKIHTSYKNFKNGVVKNPYDKEVYDVGYIGKGKYDKKNYPKVYQQWIDMLRRCYDPYYLNKKPTYIDCYVCNEWLCFQNFAKWCEENYYEVKNEIMHLDKDILIKGNKIYSPETCMFVPERINILFVKNKSIRGKYPIGISEYKEKKSNYKCLLVRCNFFDKEKNKNIVKNLKTFPINRPFQAFTCYKNFKENYIKQVADEYKELIPIKLYEAMLKYEVEIND